LYQNALAIHRDLKSEKDVAIALGDLGNIAYKRKHYDAAEQHYREALRLNGKDQKMESKEGMATQYGNLGLLALDRQRWTEAHEWFEKGLLLAREVGPQSLIAQGAYNLACVHKEEGRPDLALPLAQEALAIRERSRDMNVEVTRGLVDRLRKAVGGSQS
jgi:tetratricopeptide (TPR) repeat protein